MTNKELMEAVRAHAYNHYNDDDASGWDIIAETYDDEDLLEAIGSATTEAKAIKNVAASIATYAEYREEIRSTAF